MAKEYTAPLVNGKPAPMTLQGLKAVLSTIKDVKTLSKPVIMYNDEEGNEELNLASVIVDEDTKEVILRPASWNSMRGL